MSKAREPGTLAAAERIVAQWEAALTPAEREIGWSTLLERISWKKPPRKLKPVGFWYTGTGSMLPHPDEHRDGVWSQKERRAVLAYLRTGQVKMRYMGFAFCRCGCEDPVPGSADMTDGVWVWPEGLAHYIEEHNVRLPVEFVAHIMERS
jgi:hypothetical protein